MPDDHNIPDENMLRSLAMQLGDTLLKSGKTLAAAESCTGGWLAKVITDIPGSSSWFRASIVSYSNEAKQSLLGVDAATLEQHGAVSEATVDEMVKGVFAHTDADLAVSISGIAGPGGGSEQKPVGLVWFGLGRRNQPVATECHVFTGDREAVRVQSVELVLKRLLEVMTNT